MANDRFHIDPKDVWGVIIAAAAAALCALIDTLFKGSGASD